MTTPHFRSLIVDEPAPGVLRVRLNRPERLNAIDDGMRDELTGFLVSLSSRIESGAVQVLVLTGSGRDFSSGGDVKEFPRIFGGAPAEVERQMLAFQDLARLLSDLPIPVVAAVNGLAVGGGFALACACDLRVAAESSRFSLSFVARGLGLDLGASHFVPRLIGLGMALRLALTGETIDAFEAKKVGLVQWVVPDADLEVESLRLAQELAAREPSALAAIKRALHKSGGELNAALGLEASLQATRLAAMKGAPHPVR